MVEYNKYTIYYLSSLPTKDNLKTAWIAPNAGGKKGKDQSADEQSERDDN